MHRWKRRTVVPVSLLALIAGSAVPAAAKPAGPPDPALAWFDTTAETIAATSASSTQATDNRTWTIGWLAAAKAVRSAPPGPHSRRYADAALAGAVHETLRTVAPSRAEQLDAALRTALDHIPDGPGERRGLAAGRHQARALLAEREGDGLDPASVNTAYPTPPRFPGIWQPTPPDHGPTLHAGLRFARPFLLHRGDQFRPAAPPALGSHRYRTDLAEVRAYGAANSTVRTQEQTDTATFWYGSSLVLYTGILRAALAQSRRPPAQRITLVALFNAALVDTQIATSDTRYAYLRWRPVTAIHAADIDGDPATVADPGWSPLHVTPPLPDYPSGHNTYSGAAESVLTALIGPRAAQPYTITSPSAPGVTRTYTDWRQPTVENIDGRVWSGIHTRTADEVGARLGYRIGAYTVAHADRLLG